MRIKEAIREAGGATAVKLRGGIAIGTLNNAQSGTNLPGTETLIKLAAATGRSIDWMLTGQERSASLPPDDFVAVPRYAAALSAGGGAVVGGDIEVVEMVMFRRAWMKRIGVNPLQAHVIPVVGDSMQPTLYDGDIVLVDTAEQRPVSNAIFAIAVDDRALVKRIQLRHDGSVILVGDNPHERDEIIPSHEVAALRIIGRVRWYARTLR